MTWRHKQCNYMIPTGSKICQLCKIIIKAIYDCCKNSKSATKLCTSIQYLRKGLKRTQQNLRIKQRFANVLSELKNCKNKIMRVDNKSFFEKIDRLYNMSSTHKIWVKECFKIAKYRRKTARRYTYIRVVTNLFTGTY